MMAQQIRVVCCWALFLWHAGCNLIFVLQNSTPGGVGEPLPKTLSQMRVSRGQNLNNFSFKMPICANGLLNSCNSGINTEAHSLRSHQLADHFPLPLPIEADLDTSQTQVLEHLCPGSVKHVHTSELPQHWYAHVSSICHNRPADSHISRLSMSQISSDQNRS